MKALIFSLLLLASAPSMAASYWLYSCSSGRGVQAAPLSTTKEIPNCFNGQGSWSNVEIYDPTATTAPTIAQQLELIGVNAPSIAKTFVFGFVTYLSFWGLGFAAQAAMKAIKAA